MRCKSMKTLAFTRTQTWTVLTGPESEDVAGCQSPRETGEHCPGCSSLRGALLQMYPASDVLALKGRGVNLSCPGSFAGGGTAVCLVKSLHNGSLMPSLTLLKGRAVSLRVPSGSGGRRIHSPALTERRVRVVQ